MTSTTSSMRVLRPLDPRIRSWTSRNPPRSGAARRSVASVGHSDDTSFLCARCGAAVPVPAEGTEGSYTGSCPECGLGFSRDRLHAPRSSRFGIRRRRAARRSADAMRQFEAEFEAVFSRPPFAAYGLDEHWQGPRWPAGVGRSNGTVETIELGHGNPHDNSAPEIRVVTRRSPEPVALAYATMAQQLVHRFWRPGMPNSRAVRAPFGTDDPTDGWDDVELLVNEATTAFKILTRDDDWAAIAAVSDGSTISVEVRHAEPGKVHLVRLDDLSAYLDDAFPWRSSSAP